MGTKRTRRRRLATAALAALVVLASAGSGGAQSTSGSAPGAGEPVTPVATSAAPSVPPVTLTPVPTATTVVPTTTTPVATTTAPAATPTSTVAPTIVPTVVPTAAPTTTPTPSTVTPTPTPTPSTVTPTPTPSTVTPTPDPAVNLLDQPTPVPAPTETPSPASPPPPTEPPSAATEPPAAANATPAPATTTTTQPTPVPTTLAPTVAPTSPPPPTEPPSAASPPPPTEPPTQPPATATPPATTTPTSTAPTATTVAPAPTPTPTPTPVPTTVTPSPSSESPPPPTEPPTNPPSSAPSTPKPATTTAAPPTVTPTPTSESPPPPTQPANRTPAPNPDSGSGSSNEPSTPKPSASSKTTIAPNFNSVPSPNDDDGAGKVTSPDLSTLDPIVGDLPGASSSSNKNKKTDGSKVVENDTKSAHDSSSIGGLNLAIIVVGIVGVVIASLFFVRSRQMHRKMNKSGRDSSQQRALDEFFQANVGTTAPATGLPRHLTSNASSSQYSGGRNRGVSTNSYANEQLTPADEIALAGAAAAGRQNPNRFDDTVLRGTAAFRMNGPLPPSPADTNLTTSERASSEVDSSQPGISFVSSGSSASRYGTETNFYSEVHGSDIGDFRSTGGAQSMASGLESRRSTAVHSDSSAFSVYMKSSGGNSADLGADFRLSSGVYSVGDIESRSSRASSLSSRLTGSNRGMTRTFSHESFGSARSSGASSDGYSDNAFSIVSKDSLAFGADSMHRMSELSEGEI